MGHCRRPLECGEPRRRAPRNTRPDQGRAHRHHRAHRADRPHAHARLSLGAVRLRAHGQERVPGPARRNDRRDGGWRLPLSDHRNDRTAAQRALEPGFVNQRRRLRISIRHAQRGVVLFVAMLAIIALDRAVATDATIGGNVDARTHATLLASDAIEHALAALFETGAIADRLNDDLQHSYFASKQPGEDGRSVPRALQVIASYPTDAAVVDAGDRHQLRYLIERLCLRPGAAAADNCTLTPPASLPQAERRA